MERRRYLELGISASSLALIAAALLGAFSRRIRTQIKVRDNFTCQGCGSQDRFRLEASHIDHRRGPHYNKPENGICECPRCHLLRHLNHTHDEIGIPSEDKNDWAVGAIWTRLTDDEKQEILAEYLYLLLDNKYIPISEIYSQKYLFAQAGD